jgi:hypothetical protein
VSDSAKLPPVAEVDLAKVSGGTGAIGLRITNPSEFSSMDLETALMQMQDARTSVIGDTR